ncbi:MAG TPA: hypothetical protein VFX35_02430 [Solirubrobacterales bacterium]|nr:hypothetical protein [Solirubrobacterales bacterium]
MALALALAGCGGSGDADSTGTDTSTTTETKPAPKPPAPGSRIDDGPMTIDLKPVYKSEASGTVHYVKAPSGAALLKVRAEGLKPASAQEQYILWQYSSRNDMTILSRPRVDADGSLSEDLRSIHFLYLMETEVKVQLLISKINRKRLKAELAKAPVEGWHPRFLGEPLLRGTFARLYLESFDGKPEGS